MKRLKLKSFVLEILSDGEWHFESEIALKMLPHIPPEHAIHRRNIRQAEGVSLQDHIQRGIRFATYQALESQRKAGRIIRDDSEPMRRWRCIDETYLAFARELHHQKYSNIRGETNVHITFAGKRSPHPKVAISIPGKEPRTLAFIPASKRPRSDGSYSELGYDWGTENGGAIELARSMLRSIYPSTLDAVLNERVYRYFAREVIAKLPRDTFVLTDEQIQLWIRTALESQTSTGICGIDHGHTL